MNYFVLILFIVLISTLLYRHSGIRLTLKNCKIKEDFPLVESFWYNHRQYDKEKFIQINLARLSRSSNRHMPDRLEKNLRKWYLKCIKAKGSNDQNKDYYMICVDILEKAYIVHTTLHDAKGNPIPINQDDLFKKY